MRGLRTSSLWYREMVSPQPTAPEVWEDWEKQPSGWVVKITVMWFVKEDPYPWKEDCGRVGLHVLAGVLQAVHMAWKGEPHRHLVVRLVRTLYNGGTERTTSAATSMRCDLMGAHTVLRVVLEVAESHLPPHIARFWQWWHCFGPAAGVGSLTEAGIAVNMLGKALYLEPYGTRMDGLRWGWEGVSSSHSDLGWRKHRSGTEHLHQDKRRGLGRCPCWALSITLWDSCLFLQECL